MHLIARLSVWYVFSIPVVAGMSMFNFNIAGLNYTGWIWFLQFGVGLLVAMRSLREGMGDEFRLWLPWLAWAVVVWMFLPFLGEISPRNFQDALQLTMPVVVGLAATKAIRNRADLEKLLSMFLVTFVLLAGFVAIYVRETGDREWLATLVRSAALTIMLVGCVFLSYWPRRWVLPLLGWGACIALTTLTESRIVTVGLLIAPIVHPLLRTKLFNVLLMFATGALAIGLFYTPIFQRRFFPSGEGTLQDLFSNDFTDWGRFDAWNRVWEESWQHPLFGSGTGNAYSFVPRFWEETNHVHNDYLRVFYEQGLFGFCVLAAATIWQLYYTYVSIKSSDGVVRTALTAVWLGMCVMLISSYTDNTLTNHVFYTNPLFAVLGAAYGVTAEERKQAAGLATPAFRSFDLLGGNGKTQRLAWDVSGSGEPQGN